MKLSEIFKEALLEAKKKKPSEGLSKKEKSDVVKKAKAGEDIGKKGKGFEKLAKKAGGGEKGEKIAAAAMWKNIKKENVNEDLQSMLTDPKNWEALYDFIVLAAKSASGYLVTKSLFGNIPAFYEAFKKYPNTDQKKRIVQYYVNHIVNPKQYPIDKLEDFIQGSNSGAVTEGEDHEVSMAHNSLKSIMQSCADLMNKLGDDERDIPGWIQDHITNAENFIDQAAQGFHELGGHEEEDEDEDNDMIQPVEEDKDNNSIRYDSIYNKLNANRPTQKDNRGQKMALELSKKYSPIKGDDMPLYKYLASRGLLIVDKKDVEGINEKKLTKAEKAKKEDIIKAMAMRGGGKDKMGPKQYAIATAQAIKSAE
jgi:hypothetical protein